MSKRDLLVVTLVQGAAEVWSGAETFEEIVNTFGVVAAHCLSMVDPEHKPEMLRQLRHALDVAEERGNVGRLMVVEGGDDE